MILLLAAEFVNLRCLFWSNLKLAIFFPCSLGNSTFMVRRMKILANWKRQGMRAHLFFYMLVNDELLKVTKVLDFVLHSFTLMLRV